MTHFFLDSIGIIGPGLPHWQAALPYLAGTAAYQFTDTILPDSTLLSPREQRRANATTRLALAVAEQALSASPYTAQEVETIFASSCGEVQIMHYILEALAKEERLVSPTHFHNSVHNSPAGYWNIGTHSQKSATALAAYDNTVQAGLIKAAACMASEPAPVLLVLYDTPFPQPLHATRPLEFAFAAGLLLTPEQSAQSIAGLSLAPVKHPASSCQSAMGKALVHGNPIARIFPLLETIAQHTPGTIALEDLRIQVTPC